LGIYAKDSCISMDDLIRRKSLLMNAQKPLKLKGGEFTTSSIFLRASMFWQEKQKMFTFGKAFIKLNSLCN